MSTGISADLADVIVDDFTSAAYVKLHLGDPGASGTANPAVETTRQQGVFDPASGGAAVSNADTIWTTVAATETYSHISYWNDPTAGSFMASKALAVACAVTAGDDFQIDAGDLTVSLGAVAA